MRAVIFANGELGAPSIAAKLADQAELIIAVDGGISYCGQLNLQPHVLLGDLDSALEPLVDKAIADGVSLQRHPKDKDKTDLELALDLACSLGATRVSLFGALGGRWDMSLANLLLPAAMTYKNLRITLYDDQTRIDLLRDNEHLELTAPVGSRVSLLPINGQVEGVTLTGFEYPLTNHTLSFGSTRGISNVLVEDKGCIAVGKGLLLTIQTDFKA
jgi:thiamine pyrophosphokinase